MTGTGIKKKILIVYATAGAGHLKAALALEQAFAAIGSAQDVTVVDILDYTPALIKKMYLGVYLFMITKIPSFWGLCYYLLDNPLVNSVVRLIRRANNEWTAVRFVRLLEELKPDLVLCTHFFSAEVVGHLKLKKGFRTTLVTLVTDYRNHAFWVNRGTDLYLVATDETRDDLMRWGVPASAIRCCGLPVEERFSVPYDRPGIRARLGLLPDRLTVLVTSGGFGVGPVWNMVRMLARVPNLQMIVVCGKNKGLHERISRFAGCAPVTIKSFGYVNNMYELMAAADLVVSKTGGLSVSEALALRVPLIALSPLPGQEMRNYRYLLNAGATLPVTGIRSICRTVEKLQRSPAMLLQLQEAIRVISRPQAARAIATLIASTIPCA